MRGVIVKGIEIAAATLAVCLMFTFHALGQERDSLENECDSLKNTVSPDLVQFLNGVIPDEKSGDCVAWAIRKLGNEHFEPAIPTLVRLLDFRRPLTPREKRGFTMHPTGVWDLYPATSALSGIGKKALPAILQVIESESASSISKENAVFVWMEIYKYEPAKGVALLRQEMDKAREAAVKQRLQWALAKAVNWCNPSDQDSCRTAAKAGVT
jgi:hypothetical protein